MDEAVKRAAVYLPKSFEAAVLRLSDEESRTIRELRLRVGVPFSASTDDGERFILKSGGLSRLSRGELLLPLAADVEECVKRLCGYALHTHQEELRQGFVTAGGCRAGLGGVMVTDESGRTQSMRAIASVCLRVAREHRGCARALLTDFLRDDNGGLLICGAPGTGKTSLLRDIAHSLSCGSIDGERRRVAVVDERSELALSNSLSGCDVLIGGNKAAGIRQAVRCLSPAFLVFDEWTSEEEAAAVTFAAGSGVRIITCLHAPSFSAALMRSSVRALIAARTFSTIAILRLNHSYELITEETQYEMLGNRIIDTGNHGVGLYETSTCRIQDSHVGMG